MHFVKYKSSFLAITDINCRNLSLTWKFCCCFDAITTSCPLCSTLLCGVGIRAVERLLPFLWGSWRFLGIKRCLHTSASGERLPPWSRCSGRCTVHCRPANEQSVGSVGQDPQTQTQTCGLCEADLSIIRLQTFPTRPDVGVT